MSAHAQIMPQRRYRKRRDSGSDEDDEVKGGETSSHPSEGDKDREEGVL